MFALRRVAVRTLQSQPTRQISTLRTVSLASQLQTNGPSLCRSFHQSRRWLAEKDAVSPAEQQGGETVTAEPSVEEQKEIREESIAPSEIADGAQHGSAPAESAAQEATQEVSNATKAAKDAVSSAASTVQSVARSVGRAANFPPVNAPTNPSGASSTKILYIGNLFFEVTAAELEAEFAKFGEIVNSRVVKDGDGMSKGFGYIEFSNQDAAERAIRELDQKVFQGRRLAVQYHVRRDSKTRARGIKRENPASKTLFIGNMSYQMSDRDLNDLFREIRNVLDVRVAIDRRSGQPRGFAHADFIDVASAEKAKQHLENKVVYGRQLRVDFSSATADPPSA